MVSFINCIVAVAVAVATFASPSVAGLDVNLLPEGAYFKPSGRIVSGAVGATTPFRRCPCPALNALANHGYLPRNGQNITKAVLGPAVMSVYNLGQDATNTLLSLLPETFSLDFLSTHNALEHDASLIHNDEYFGGDPAAVNMTLAKQLFELGKSSGTLGVKELGAARKTRLADSLAINPNVTFGAAQQRLAFLEGSILLLGFGTKAKESVSVDVARSFLIDEKIPDGWTRSTTVITSAVASDTSAKIVAAAA